ncbi:MAG: arginine deiminase family protein [Phycisphaerales bacterium]|nr:arginine deiminase family protein [Phycisphaerales bacterium]
MLLALTRQVSRSIQECELTHMAREPLSHAEAAAQHAAYVSALRSMGVTVIDLEPLHHHPDAVFVEDILVVVDELAVRTRPGAESRRGEVDSAVETVSRYRTVAAIEPPGTLEGGDVMQVDHTIFVGRSTRTNDEGISQLRSLLQPHGYSVVAVPVPGALHLKTAATYLGDGTILANSEWVDVSHFSGLDVIETHPDEPFAGNAIRIGDAVLFPSQFPHTAGRLEARGFRLVTVPSTELAKAEGSLTCKSVIFTDHGGEAT